MSQSSNEYVKVDSNTNSMRSGL